MVKRTVEVSETPQVTVRECLGSLTVKGGEERELTLIVQDGNDELDLEHEGDSVAFSATGDCTLLCPSGTTLDVESVKGNLRVDSVRGSIDAGSIYGNANLRAVGGVTLEEALGNLNAHQVAGNLEVREVKGNVRVSAVEGQLVLAQAGGNLKAEGLAGGLDVSMVRGNATMGPPFSPDLTYRVKASGNATVHVPAEADLRLVGRVRGNARSTVPGLDLKRDKLEVTASLGDGRAVLEVDVMGNLSLRSEAQASVSKADFDLDDLGAQIEWQVNQAMAEMASRLESSLGHVDAEAIQRRVERATERARRQAERAAEQARLRAERAERRWKRASGQKPPSDEPATDEERLRVLRMLEEGKITPEQASDLLDALEGGG